MKLGDQMEKKAQQDRELILESIFYKWNPIALGCRNNHGSTDCPLCREYFVYSTRCSACPIKLRTGYNFCAGTPYEHFLKRALHGKDCSETIEAELEFLISLLPLEDQENLESLHKEWTIHFKELK